MLLFISFLFPFIFLYFCCSVIIFKIASLHVTSRNFPYFSKSVILPFVPSFFYLSTFFFLFLCIVFQPLASSSLKSGLGRTKVHSGVKEWKLLILKDQVDTPCPINVFPSADSICDIPFHQDSRNFSLAYYKSYHHLMVLFERK